MVVNRFSGEAVAAALRAGGFIAPLDPAIRATTDSAERRG
jgi:hypothetical protein